jgi:hypothetical protein
MYYQPTYCLSLSSYWILLRDACLLQPTDRSGEDILIIQIGIFRYLNDFSQIWWIITGGNWDIMDLCYTKIGSKMQRFVQFTETVSAIEWFKTKLGLFEGVLNRTTYIDGIIRNVILSENTEVLDWLQHNGYKFDMDNFRSFVSDKSKKLVNWFINNSRINYYSAISSLTTDQLRWMDENYPGMISPTAIGDFRSWDQTPASEVETLHRWE